MTLELQRYAENAAEIKAEIKKLEDRLNLIKDRLIQSGPANYITKLGLVQVVEIPETLIFNSKLFQEEHPKLYNMYLNQKRKGATAVKFAMPK